MGTGYSNFTTLKFYHMHAYVSMCAPSLDSRPLSIEKALASIEASAHHIVIELHPLSNWHWRHRIIIADSAVRYVRNARNIYNYISDSRFL